MLNNGDTEDRINHGTAVTRVILGCDSANIEGMATSARIVPIVVTDKVEGKETTISPETLATAIRDSVDKYGASIVNDSYFRGLFCKMFFGKCLKFLPEYGIITNVTK